MYFVNHKTNTPKCSCREAETLGAILIKFSIINCALDPTPRKNLGEGNSTWVIWAHTRLATSSSSFSFLFFLLSSPWARVAFLDRSWCPYVRTRVSNQGCAFGDLDNIWLLLCLLLWGWVCPPDQAYLFAAYQIIKSHSITCDALFLRTDFVRGSF